MAVAVIAIVAIIVVTTIFTISAIIAILGVSAIFAIAIFNSAINFLASFCNVSVLLCSATQPLLDEIQSYRLITPRNIVGDIDKYTEAFRRVKIEDCSQGNGKTFAEAADFIFEKAQSVNSILAIAMIREPVK